MWSSLGWERTNAAGATTARDRQRREGEAGHASLSSRSSGRVGRHGDAPPEPPCAPIFSGGTRAPLNLIRDEATLRVEPAKSGDSVVLDGRPIGTGPSRTRTTSGLHRVETFDGGTPVYATELTLRPGEERAVAAPSRGLSWGWYAGGAAVLVGGATLGYFLLREDSPGRVGSAGTLNPQRIDVPSR